MNMHDSLNTELKVQETDRFTRIILTGEADIDFVNTLSSTANELEKKKSKSALVVDMEGVTYIDSASLGVFVRLIKIHKDSGRRIIIYKPQQMIKGLFDQTGLSSMLQFCNSEDEIESSLSPIKKKRRKKQTKKLSR